MSSSQNEKYALSFCEVTRLSENVYEAVEFEDAVINEQCAVESWDFWEQLRTEPFGLLVRCNEEPLSFLGSKKIGGHPLQEKTALLLNSASQREKVGVVMDIKKEVGIPIRHRVFFDEKTALEWLAESA